MRKIFYSLLFLACALTVQAQNVRKIPFLPYLQAGGVGGDASSADTPFQGNNAPRTLKKISTIYFAPEQSTLKKENLGTLQSVISQAEQENAAIHLYTYATPEMSPSIGDERLKSVENALKDINPSISVYRVLNNRVNPIITPHRVEIFLK